MYVDCQACKCRTLKWEAGDRVLALALAKTSSVALDKSLKLFVSVFSSVTR